MVPRESPSMSNSHHTSQGRRNKLSVWVKKIINTTTTTNASVSSSKPRRGTRAGPTRVKRAELDPDGTTISSSLRPLVDRNSLHSSESDDEGDRRVAWDEPPTGKVRQQQQQQQQQNDNASVIPLVSFCSSSVKSSTFSDIHSIQSTRPTIFSNRTFETNSSVLAIPPQSILDRSRTLPPSNASNTTTRRP
ncbi:CIC_collapsed_G0035020.mRNA.1.CDS.1 [Saccharomyces cerevisiae]|nr:SX2_G0005270.mRNA.1.CDS.1 [Saccharomyces cerevisiae]CAI4590366.1 BGN_3a_G0033680.mRNA.1.CDS.1 [Saccharomyces cerevisiae]CAI7211476.1 BGN_3a_G0033680.mRNA.1.CDS.1 [Saccharomyces cerevisiae]CAI7399911.1 CIC_collapsed_G0035020.mRNA.1.CDS.1 [Saccharomyces cerevisiae]